MTGDLDDLHSARRRVLVRNRERQQRCHRCGKAGGDQRQKEPAPDRIGLCLHAGRVGLSSGLTDDIEEREGDAPESDEREQPDLILNGHASPSAEMLMEKLLRPAKKTRRLAAIISPQAEDLQGVHSR